MAWTGISRMCDQLEDNIMTWTISQKNASPSNLKGFFSFNKWSLSIEGFGLNCDAEAYVFFKQNIPVSYFPS